MTAIRLQKILARAGLGSRRQCETYITEGRVAVDGTPVTQLGAKADPETQSVTFDNQPIQLEQHAYYILNKPRGVVSSSADPSGRPVAVELPGVNERLFAVGRLDMETSGLLLLTNDGGWSQKLMHPRFKVEKVYEAVVVGEISQDALEKLRAGVHLAEGKTAPAWVELTNKVRGRAKLKIIIREGMNRQVRRMLARVDLNCKTLRRTSIGPLRLGSLKDGAYRRLGKEEIRKLEAAADLRPNPEDLRKLDERIRTLEAAGPDSKKALHLARRDRAMLQWRLGKTPRGGNRNRGGFHKRPGERDRTTGGEKDRKPFNRGPRAQGRDKPPGRAQFKGKYGGGRDRPQAPSEGRLEHRRGDRPDNRQDDRQGKRYSDRRDERNHSNKGKDGEYRREDRKDNRRAGHQNSQRSPYRGDGGKKHHEKSFDNRSRNAAGPRKNKGHKPADTRGAGAQKRKDAKPQGKKRKFPAATRKRGGDRRK